MPLKWKSFLKESPQEPHGGFTRTLFIEAVKRDNFLPFPLSAFPLDYSINRFKQ